MFRLNKKLHNNDTPLSIILYFFVTLLPRISLYFGVSPFPPILLVRWTPGSSSVISMPLSPELWILCDFNLLYNWFYFIIVVYWCNYRVILWYLLWDTQFGSTLFLMDMYLHRSKSMDLEDQSNTVPHRYEAYSTFRFLDTENFHRFHLEK